MTGITDFLLMYAVSFYFQILSRRFLPYVILCEANRIG